MTLRSLLTAAITLFVINNALAAPKVVTSIKPLHSLVSAIMGNVGTPVLLLNGQASPHDATLRPSQARALQNANLIFWIGPELEKFLEKPMATLSSGAKPITLIELKGLEFPEHTDIHADQHDDHHHDRDPHIWLDPQNAELMVLEISRRLSLSDKQNADIYAKNSASLIKKIRDETTKITKILGNISSARYITFHDAYGHFEHRFNLPGGIAITTNLENRPGAARIQKLREKIESEHISCLFAEPQFDPKLILMLTEGTNLRAGELDPLGSKFPAGPELYTTLLGKLANSFNNCLSAK